MFRYGAEIHRHSAKCSAPVAGANARQSDCTLSQSIPHPERTVNIQIEVAGNGYQRARFEEKFQARGDGSHTHSNDGATTQAEALVLIRCEAFPAAPLMRVKRIDTSAHCYRQARPEILADRAGTKGVKLPDVIHLKARRAEIIGTELEIERASRADWAAHRGTKWVPKYPADANILSRW